MHIQNYEESLELLQFIKKDPNIYQRELTQKSTSSPRKVNYSLKALIEIEYLKMKNFENSDKEFLIKKQQEYNKITSYISS